MGGSGRTNFAKPLGINGWTPAGELLPGDRVLGLDHEWITIDEVVTTERFSKVYNLRVEQDHTYFVGGDDWNFAVWVHNDYDPIKKAEGLYEVVENGSNQVKGKIEVASDGKAVYTPKDPQGIPVEYNSLDDALDDVKKWRSPDDPTPPNTAGKNLKEGMDKGNARAAGEVAAPKGVGRFPAEPDDFSRVLGVEPKISTTQHGSRRYLWEPNSNTCIRFESHPDDAGTFNPQHHGEHYHIEIKPDNLTWNQEKKKGLISKVKPEDYIPGHGTGHLPGEPFPGQ